MEPSKQSNPFVIHEPKVSLLFLDSGAHSLYNREVKGKRWDSIPQEIRDKLDNMTGGEISVLRKESPRMFRDTVDDWYTWYETDDFWNYVDAYAEFLKQYKGTIDYYANVDVIFNPEISWRVLKYLENEHGLNPVPVIHYGTPLKWVHRHLKAGYELIGLGGLGQEVTRNQYFSWADSVFEVLCPGPKHLPIVRTHGFAMTSHRLMTRYPWWSVDSASWIKIAGFGNIYVPRRLRPGVFDPLKPPYIICTSSKSPEKSKQGGKHYCTLSRAEKKVVEEWLELFDIPMGKVDDEGESTAWGVQGDYAARATANLFYFQWLMDNLPAYPQIFKVKLRRAKGLWE